MQASDPWLRKQYLYINQRLFDNALPLTTKLWWQPCDKALAYTFQLSPVGVEPVLLGIQIDPIIHGLSRLTMQTIAHESAHVKLWPQRNPHGKDFDDEIQRLCKLKLYRRWL